MAEKRVVQLMRLLSYPTRDVRALPITFDADRITAVERVLISLNPEEIGTLVTLDNSLAIKTLTPYEDVLKLIGWVK